MSDDRKDTGTPSQLDRAEGTILVDDVNVCFGDVTAWRAFVRRHRKFMDNLQGLKELNARLLSRGLRGQSETASVIFILGWLMVDEFYEVLLLAANEHGQGAIRITRVMFEQLVTAKFLHQHPEETSRYLDFHHVSQRRLMSAMKTVYPDRPWTSPEKMEEIERDYERVKERFTVADCKKCGTRRVHHTWHHMDVISMANSVGLGNVSFMGYSIPMQENHATVASLLGRIQEHADGTLSLRTSTPNAGDKALCGAHANLLYMLELHIDHFSADVEHERPALREQLNRFHEIWQRQPDDPTINAVRQETGHATEE